MARVVVCISGASGIVLAYKTVYALCMLDHTVDLIMSRDAMVTALQEMGPEFASSQKFVQSFPEEFKEKITIHGVSDFGSDLASGSAHFDACIIIPCSMATLAAIACGLSDNLIRRTADVALKERRNLVIVPREAPLNAIHLENMLKLSRLGAVLYPPQPAWYLPEQNTIDDVENNIVSRVLDQVGIKTDIAPRWQGIKREKSYV